MLDYDAKGYADGGGYPIASISTKLTLFAS